MHSSFPFPAVMCPPHWLSSPSMFSANLLFISLFSHLFPPLCLHFFFSFSQILPAHPLSQYCSSMWGLCHCGNLRIFLFFFFLWFCRWVLVRGGVGTGASLYLLCVFLLRVCVCVWETFMSDYFPVLMLTSALDRQIPISVPRLPFYHRAFSVSYDSKYIFPCLLTAFG